MALFELPRASITFDVAPANSLTVRCSYVNAKLPITEEVPSLVVKIDQTYLGTVESYGNSIAIGNTVHVWLDRWVGGSTQKNVFNGIVSRLAKDMEGHTPRWYEVEAVGFADHLNRVYVGYTSTVGAVSNLITAFVQPAVDAGYITIGSINNTTAGTYSFDHSGDQLNVFNALVEISKDKKWEWRVDNERKFYAHPTTAHTHPVGFSTNILSAQYEEDGRNIINSQRVLGPDGNAIGEDSDEFTDSLEGWTSSADWTSLCAGNEKGLFTLPYFGVIGGWGVGPSRDNSTYSLVFNWINASEGTSLWTRKTFEDPLDLTYYGILKFDIQWAVMVEHPFSTEKQNFDFKVRFETDSSNYFEYQYKVSEIMISKTQFPFFGIAVDSGWKSVDVPFNLKVNKSGYVKVGNPAWNNIIALYIEIINPRSMDPGGIVMEYFGQLHLDNLWISNGHYYAFRYDSASIATYGERRGHLIHDDSFSSDGECGEIADSIINYYKNPIKKFTNVTLADIPATIPLGYISTITVSEVVQPSVIRSVTYTLEDFKLSTELELSSVYIPDIESIISDLKKVVDELDQDALPEDINPAVVSNLLNAPIGIKDIDLSKNQDNLISNPRFEIDSNGDDIPDSWYPSGNWNIPFRTQDEVSSGQYAGLVPGSLLVTTWYPRTLSSELFPIDPLTNHFVSIWAKSSHDVDHTGTFTVELEYFGIAPTYTSLGKLAIASAQYTNEWTEYDKTASKTDLPAGVKWGRLNLIGVKGSSYFDDCLVQRFVGTDGGQVSLIRPLEYTTSSESPVLVYSKTFEPGVMPIKYVATGIQADLKVDTPDGGNFSNLIVITKYNGSPVNTLDVSTTEDEWDLLRLNNNIDVGDYATTLVVDFYLSCGNYQHAAYMRNAEIMTSSYSIKTPVRSRFNQNTKE